MGKISAEDGPVFSPLKTTDDDDDEERATGDGGPTRTRYRDEPESPFDWGSGGGAAGEGGGRGRTPEDVGPPVRYRDEPESPFDWGSDGGEKERKDKKEKNKGANDDDDDAYPLGDFDMDDAGFAPIPLHDTDSDTDDGGEDDGEGKEERVRAKAQRILNERARDDADDDEEDQIFVGGGWGRHGSQFSLCPRGPCGRCARGGGPRYSKLRPPPPKSGTAGTAFCGMVRTALWAVSFLALLFGAGLFGFEAGQPADEDFDFGNATDPAEGGEGAVHHPTAHTRGEEWLKQSQKWLEKEREGLHAPHWRAKKDHPGFKKPVFDPMTQTDLLKLSEETFQACGETSLETSQGRAACLSLCHGHYCCFETEESYGSCVALENSYCFAYAACEAVVSDFMANVAGDGDSDGGAKGWTMTGADYEFVQEACSEENVATPEGRRDCEAVCDRHLCCFDEAKWGECSAPISMQCVMYDGCGILVDREEADANPPPPLTDDSTPGQEKAKGGNVGAGGGGGGGGGGGAGAGGLRDHPAFQLPKFKPMSQDQLLELTEDVYAACTAGNDESRDECLKLCHGHYCCFERHDDFGSCAHMEDANCFAYEACENVVADFMDGIAGALAGGEYYFSENDEMLLRDECSEENVAFPDGRRDCEAFCEHYMCCFDEDQYGECPEDREDCQEFEKCAILLDVFDAPGQGSIAAPTPGDGGGGMLGNNEAIANPPPPLKDDSKGALTRTPGQENAKGNVGAGGGGGGGGGAGAGGLRDHPAFQLPKFKPMTEDALCDLAEDVYAACTTDTDESRDECLTLCHGHYCCFEQDKAFGSCAHMTNANCWAYEACENVVADIMDGIAGAPAGGQYYFSENGEMLLRDECSEESVATPNGRRDCEAFCERYMCCFDEDQYGECAEDRAMNCQGFEKCSILLDVFDAPGQGTV